MEGPLIISAILNSLIFSHVTCFMTGAPDWSCKDPSAFHTLRLNASHEGIIMPQDMKNNPYAIDVDVSSFKPGSTVKGSYCLIYLQPRPTWDREIQEILALGLCKVLVYVNIPGKGTRS